MPEPIRKAVKQHLKRFTPFGLNRQKVVTLLDEIRKIDLDKLPHAFCFLLRSMFEISAKAYCIDHTKDGLSSTDKNGNDKKLVNLLREIVKHLTNNNANHAKLKTLHGAMTALASSDSVLSVTSMNQLVHNPSFSMDGKSVSVMFFNVFPLLEEMNS